jgi:hypothetical protein
MCRTRLDSLPNTPQLDSINVPKIMNPVIRKSLQWPKPKKHDAVAPTGDNGSEASDEVQEAQAADPLYSTDGPYGLDVFSNPPAADIE